MQRILRVRDVVNTVGLSRSRVYDLIRAGQFPAPVRLGDRAVGWPASEISSWIDQRIAEREQLQAAE